jgi:hypothetical protein
MDNLINNDYNNILHFYLWVSHGANVSSNRNYYPIETKFAALTFYSHPFETIYETFLDTLDKSIKFENTEGGSIDICKLMTGSCPIIPVINKDTKQKIVYLPPLIFTPEFPEDLKNDDESAVKYIGLYYFSLIKTNNDNCKVIESKRILTNNDLINLQLKTITYSTIFQKVLQDCEKKKLDPNSVMLGIYSCQSKYDKYIPEYNQLDITNMIPKYANISIDHAYIINNIYEYNPNAYSSPCFIIDNNQFTGWEALGNIKTQGCGLNILSYYGIISKTSAREETVCLTSKGTSIFRILDYINQNYFIKKYNVNNMEYLILRLEIKNGITILIDFMKNYKTHNKYAIIFKIYRENTFLDKKQGNIYSEVGHTVSVACYNEEISYIDPQGSVFINFQGTQEEQVNQLSNYLLQNSFKYIDIIFTYNNRKQPYDSNLPTINKSIIEQGINNGNCVIRPRPVDLVYGGKNKNKNKKKTYKTYKQKGKKIKTRTIKNIHKKSKNTHRNNKKNNSNKQYGGYDTFEEVMLDTDKNNGIKSNIILQS